MEVTTRCINTIRVLAADMVQQANSGHPGAPMGCAPMAQLLWMDIMKYNPANPKWINRDRFVLSNGHSCALQYVMLHLTGYDVSMDDLKAFRQLHAKTAGHPENLLCPGIEVSTGPLGQGISNAVGIAMAERHLGGVFNTEKHKIVDHFTYVICGDGCMQEGVASEASSLAGHHKLGKLIVLYDDNKITIDGDTAISFTEDVLKRYEAYGWHVQTIADGNTTDLSDLRAAVVKAKQVTDKPSIIKVRTTIGLGSVKENTGKVHGSPLGAEDLGNVKKLYGFNPEETFAVPAEVATHFAKCKPAGEAIEAEWNTMFAAYKAENAALASEFERRIAGKLPEGWAADIPKWTPADSAMATRKSSFCVLEKVIKSVPELLGGSADLTGSNLTRVEANSTDFTVAEPTGRYVRFGVREHGMAAVCNGMAAHGGIIPFGATFLVFAGYCLGSIRLSALSGFRVLYVLTHDSIGVGEDGPTHQPIESLASLRSIPNIYVMRPADANEVAGAYVCGLEFATGPTVYALSRQNCDNLEGSSAEKVQQGAYVLTGDADPKIVLVGTGSEVQLIVKVAAALREKGVAVQVVSMPCWELFEKTTKEYKLGVFPAGVPVLSVEAAATFGWQKYSHEQHGMTTFGESAPGAAVFEKFGFTVPNILEKAEKTIAFYKGAAPSLVEKAC